MEHWPEYEAKMEREGLSDAAIKAFQYNFETLLKAQAGELDLDIPEATINPVDSLQSYLDLPEAVKPELLKETVMLKLNGGLGTGMGLDRAKSLLPLKDGLTFLDFIAQQVLDMRERFGVDLAFMLSA